jgi:nitrite reductase/ring-hydroxylating ferredoxin subunit
MSADVGAVGDFVDQRVRIVDVGRRQIGIVRWGDAFYAISNVCSHQGGPLCRGVLSACLTAAEPGNLVLDQSTPLLACPWHGWEFDVRTGRAILDPRLRVRTFPVHVADGRVLVNIGGASASAEAAGDAG